MDNFDPEKIPAWQNDAPQAAESGNSTQVENSDSSPSEPVAAEPAPTAAPDAAASPEPDLDQLLAEFDRANPPATPVAPDPVPAATVEAFDKATADADAARQDYEQRAFLFEQDKAFDAWTTDLQSKMPAWSPPDAFRKEALLAAMQNPELVAAFRSAHVYKIDPAAAVAEHNQIATALRAGLVLAEQLQAARQRLSDLALAVNAPQMLHRAAYNIISEARKHPPIDMEATETKAIVSHAVRGASTANPPAEPAPDLSRLSDHEFRRYTEENFRFSAI